MITAVHTLIYTDDAPATRAFFRDVLGLPSVDTGGGWLIFMISCDPSVIVRRRRSWISEAEGASRAIDPAIRSS